MVPDRLQVARLVAADQGVGILLFGIFAGEELLLAHVRGIEVGAERTVSVAFGEGKAVGAVPGAVVDVRPFALEARETVQVLLAAETLVPVDVVHFRGGLLEIVEDLAAVVGDTLEERGTDLDGSELAQLFLHRVALGGTSGRHGQTKERK